MEKKSFSAKEISGIAVLLALVVALQTISAVIPLTALLNLALVPIVLAAIIFGPFGGAAAGFACGVVVLAQVISGGTSFYVLIWANDPIVTVFTCLIKTTAAGLVAGYVYRWLEKKNKLVATFAAAGLAPVVNTGLFVLGALCMTNSVHATAESQNVLVFILVGLVGANFFIEFAFNLFVSPTLNRVIEIVLKNFKGFKRR